MWLFGLFHVLTVMWSLKYVMWSACGQHERPGKLSHSDHSSVTCRNIRSPSLSRGLTYNTHMQQQAEPNTAGLSRGWNVSHEHQIWRTCRWMLISEAVPAAPVQPLWTTSTNSVTSWKSLSAPAVIFNYQDGFVAFVCHIITEVELWSLWPWLKLLLQGGGVLLDSKQVLILDLLLFCTKHVKSHIPAKHKK